MKAEMKTPEEIYLKHVGKGTNVKSVYYQRCLDAMQEYADQQSASLRQEVERLKLEAEYWKYKHDHPYSIAFNISYPTVSDYIKKKTQLATTHHGKGGTEG